MKKYELLPCPFCGGEAALKYTNTINSHSPEVAFVMCTCCGTLSHCFEENVKLCAADAAAEFWNTRIGAGNESL